ncbi:hypothetical protein [Viridibacterium curvum]|uniref:Uncharacterized protein n=1 Tax=Viridibacterium curvum TaxID=1101404 RepID=A0ABP9QRD6_9RHOO
MREELPDSIPGMQRISSLSLEKHEGPYGKWPRQTRLYVDGRDTQRTVAGYVIEAQYRCAAGYLLVLSQDCLFEESCDCVLLDAQFNTLAETGLGAMYCSFLLDTHWPISATCLRLHFYGDYFYDLHIETAMPFCMPVARSLMDRVWCRLRGGVDAASRNASEPGIPSGPAWRLRLSPFDDYRNDPFCMAAIQDQEARLEKIREADPQDSGGA